MNIGCNNQHSDGVSETLKMYGLTYEQVYESRESIANFAKKIKSNNKSEFCVIPFCHTVEAEAMGGKIVLGDETAGSRAGEIVYKTIDEILKSKIDFSNKRLSNMLTACRILKNDGEKVVFTLTGAMSILNCLIDATVVFKAVRKTPEMVDKLFSHLANELTEFTKMIVEAGADYISFGDPVATPKILGAKFTKYLIDNFTLVVLEKIQPICKNKTDILICPITYATLKAMDLVKFQEISNEKGTIIPCCSKAGKIPNISVALKKITKNYNCIQV